MSLCFEIQLTYYSPLYEWLYERIAEIDTHNGDTIILFLIFMKSAHPKNDMVCVLLCFAVVD